jgi:hypothetical protein
MALIDLLQATQPNQLPTTGYGDHSLSITNESYNHGEDISPNPQAVKPSQGGKSIHSNGNADDSYSLNGTNLQGAQNIFNAYNIPPSLLGYGASNVLPVPSILDENGEKPTPSYFTDNVSTTRTNIDRD